MEVPIIIQNMSNIDDSHTDKLNIIISLLENMKKKNQEIMMEQLEKSE